ncbi:MAG: 1,4-dihydroxy-6-naphthoate synthase [Opitutales bacterium]|nr:1,4-dihydroxy-6-naphthoate synthase [Opitutales bacterium]
MKFAISPCPNDTFSFYALIKKIIASDFEFVFDDIENLNLSAEKKEYPITKLSFAQYLNVQDDYELLDAGSALGIGTGPVLVGNVDSIDKTKPIAVPGMNTTASLLLKYYLGKDVILEPMYFRDVAERVANGEFQAGVLIHEGRFVFESQGLKLLADLGNHWTEKSGLAVPLGCICVRRDFLEMRNQIEDLIRQSLKIAFDNPEATYPYVASMAQHLQGDVLQKHIYAFVNEFSFDISHLRAKLLEELAKC